MFRLAIDGLEAGYGAVRALHGVSLEVRQGETVALLGTNGNGKSTLMKCIMGLLKPSRGIDHSRNGRRAHRTDRQEVRMKSSRWAWRWFRRAAGFSPSSASGKIFCSVHSGARHVARSSRILRSATKPSRCCRNDPRQLAGSLSGGQQQMLAIARAIMSAPRLLLVDEPSVGLSPVLVKQMIDTIAALKQRFGLTVLMAEQNFHQASRIADRGYIIVHGEIAFEGRNLLELQGSDLVKSYYLGS